MTENATLLRPPAPYPTDEMTSAELFAGYGGLGRAVETMFNARTLWFSEFDAAPASILAHHWPDVPNFGDVTKIDWDAMAQDPLMRPRVLSGGFPCQDVSLAGRRAGMTGETRSGLWFHFLRGIIAMQPDYVLAENVRGILSAKAIRDMPETPETAEVDAKLLELVNERDLIDLRRAENDYVTDNVRTIDQERWEALENHIASLMEQRTGLLGERPDEPILRALGAVLGDLADAGYDAQWCGLRAADVGAPHGRFRVFILGTRRDLITADAVRG